MSLSCLNTSAATESWKCFNTSLWIWKRREQLKLCSYLRKTFLILYFQYSEAYYISTAVFTLHPENVHPPFVPFLVAPASFLINWLLARLPEVYFNSHYISSASDWRTMFPGLDRVNSLQIIFQQIFMTHYDPVMILGTGDTMMNKVSACKGFAFLVRWWQ